MDQTTKRDLRIHGPTVADKFFIADNDNNVWDGESWRGFGMARLFDNFRAAFVESSELQNNQRNQP